MPTSKQKNLDRRKLKELGKLAADVFARRKGALEEFNAKAADIGLAPQINVEKVDDFETYKDVFGFLQRNKSQIMESLFVTELKPILGAFRSEFKREQCSKQFDAFDALASIALYDYGDLGTAALFLTKLPGVVDEVRLSSVNLVNFVNAIGSYEEEIANMRLESITFVKEVDERSGLILHYLVKNILNEETNWNPSELDFAFSAFNTSTRVQFLTDCERKELFKLAASRLNEMVHDGYNEVLLTKYFFTFILYSEGMEACYHDSIVIEAIKLIPELASGATDQSDFSEFVEMFEDLNRIMGENGTQEMKRWWYLNKERFPRLVACKDGSGGSPALAEIDERLKALEESMDGISGNISKRLNNTGHSNSSYKLEDAGKGYIRKHNEAVISGNFGILEYDGRRIVYALVNYEEIDNIGLNIDGLILVARDKVVNSQGKEDADLQKIVAVHEYVEAIALKEGKSNAETHDLAIKAQEEFVAEHMLEEKYEDFQKRAGQNWSNGEKHFSFE